MTFERIETDYAVRVLANRTLLNTLLLCLGAAVASTAALSFEGGPHSGGGIHSSSGTAVGIPREEIRALLQPRRGHAHDSAVDVRKLARGHSVLVPSPFALLWACKARAMANLTGSTARTEAVSAFCQTIGEVDGSPNTLSMTNSTCLHKFPFPASGHEQVWEEQRGWNS